MAIRFIDLFSDNPNSLDRKNEIRDFLKTDTVEIKSPTKTYRLVDYIASGTYGDVFISDNLAIKISDTQGENLREAYANILLSDKCKYIVKLYEAFTYKFDSYIYLVQVYELMDGTIAHQLLDYNSICNLLIFLLRTVECLHQNGFAHMDIKSENILYKGNCFKLGDLGLVCSENDKTGIIANTNITIMKCRYLTMYVPGKYKNIKDLQELSFEDAQALDLWAIGVVIYRKTMPKYGLDARTSLKLGNTTMDKLPSLDPRFTLKAGEKIPIHLSKPPTSGPIPVKVFENVLSMLLDDGKFTLAKDILKYLEEHVDLGKFKNC